MTTNTQWLTEFQTGGQLSISGVNQLDEIPTSIDSSNLPIGFPVFPGVARGLPIGSCVDDSKVRSIQYRVAVVPVAQGTVPQNYNTTTPIIDNLETALDAVTIMNFVTYTIEVQVYDHGGHDYLSLLATVEGRNHNEG